MVKLFVINPKVILTSLTDRYSSWRKGKIPLELQGHQVCKNNSQGLELDHHSTSWSGKRHRPAVRGQTQNISCVCQPLRLPEVLVRTDVQYQTSS